MSKALLAASLARRVRRTAAIERRSEREVTGNNQWRRRGFSLSDDWRVGLGGSEAPSQ